MERFYGGLDLGSRKTQVCVINESCIQLVNKKVSNDLAAVESLIYPYKRNLKLVVESSFNWYWIVDGLQDSGYDICLAHTLGLSFITKAKIKTDKRDAFSLARLLKAQMIPSAYIYPQKMRPARDLFRKRLKLVNKRSEEYASLSRLLMSFGILDVSLSDIKQIKFKDLTERIQSHETLLDIQFRLERIQMYTKQIHELEHEALKRVKNKNDFILLKSVPGIGRILAMTIYYEIGEISRFKNARNFSSYCRLIPGVAQSGKSTRRGRGSKQGNHYLKWAFSMAATIAVRYYSEIRRCFDRHLRRHVGNARKIVTYNIIAHKLAQAVYHVMSKQEEYRESLLFGNQFDKAVNKK